MSMVAARESGRIFTAACWPALRQTTAGSPTFDGMEALVCMAIAVLVVVLVDGAMLLAHTRRHG